MNERATVQVVKDISRENGGEPVSASEVAAEMDIPMVSPTRDFARQPSKDASNGPIWETHITGKSFFQPKSPGFLPDPAVILSRSNCGKDQVPVIHPY